MNRIRTALTTFYRWAIWSPFPGLFLIAAGLIGWAAWEQRRRDVARPAFERDYPIAISEELRCRIETTLPVGCLHCHRFMFRANADEVVCGHGGAR